MSADSVLAHGWGPAPRSVAVGVVALLCACAPDSRSAASGPVDTATLPTVTAELEMQVGSVDDPNYSLTLFVAMAVDESGRMFTVHPQEQLVRVFSPDGALERVVGRRGDGPGEFQRPSAVGWVSDSLWVLDAANDRFSLFDRAGEHLYSFTVPFEPASLDGGPSPRASGLLWDGRAHGSPPLRPLAIDAGVETERFSMLLERDGSVADTLGIVPIGRTTWTVESGGRNMFFTQPFVGRPAARFFDGEEAMAILDPRIAVDSDSATYTVSKVAFSGDTLFAARLTSAPVPVSDAWVEQEIDRYGATVENVFGLAPAEARARLRETLVRPRVHPGALGMLVSQSGEIWIQELASSPNAQWVVVDPQGEPAFRVAFPGAVQILVVGEGHAWGRLDDELGVPFLVRYRFERP